MQDDLIIRIFRAYEKLQNAKKALLDELERKLHPFLEVLGAIIMFAPLLWFFSLLFGASE
ncbi:hypothetical protein [Thalassospira profundimaris]|uniref:hypothetical protein n=1 Tax=Thalassospira profundimaris TaxID=502049 RepID=UPI00031A279B|nr:hypothetical protein [Thalassospira profundimaris]